MEILWIPALQATELFEGSLCRCKSPPNRASRRLSAQVYSLPSISRVCRKLRAFHLGRAKRTGNSLDAHCRRTRQGRASTARLVEANRNLVGRRLCISIVSASDQGALDEPLAREGSRLPARRKAKLTTNAFQEKARLHRRALQTASPQAASLLVITMQPLAANMPPTPRHTDTSAPSTCAGAVPRIWRTLSCKAYMPYMPECM